MSNAVHSGKGKQKQQGLKRPNAGAKAANTFGASLKGRQPDVGGKRGAAAKGATAKGISGAKSMPRKSVSVGKGVAVPAATRAKFRTGINLLTNAMDFHSGQALPSLGSGNTPMPFDDFENAYSSLIEAIPRQMWRTILLQMRRSIDKVAEAKLNVKLGDVPANDEGKVSTADFMAELERQEQEQRNADLEAEQLLPVTEMRERLQVTPQAISAALKKNRIFAMKGPSGRLLYPAFFADPAYDRSVLEQVCVALGELPAGSKWDFFTTPRNSLGGKTPLDALAKGKVDAVMSAANAFRDE